MPWPITECPALCTTSRRPRTSDVEAPADQQGRRRPTVRLVRHGRTPRSPPRPPRRRLAHLAPVTVEREFSMTVASRGVVTGVGVSWAPESRAACCAYPCWGLRCAECGRAFAGYAEGRSP
jgi:hypothetical protein